MKRIVAFLLTGMMMLLMVACSGDTNTDISADNATGGVENETTETAEKESLTALNNFTDGLYFTMDGVKVDLTTVTMEDVEKLGFTKIANDSEYLGFVMTYNGADWTPFDGQTYLDLWEEWPGLRFIISSPLDMFGEGMDEVGEKIGFANNLTMISTKEEFIKVFGEGIETDSNDQLVYVAVGNGTEEKPEHRLEISFSYGYFSGMAYINCLRNLETFAG